MSVWNSKNRDSEYFSLNNLIKFNEGIDKEVGAEDITPVLNYISIKGLYIFIYIYSFCY